MMLWALPIVIWWGGVVFAGPCMLARSLMEEVNPSFARYQRILDIVMPRELYDRRGGEFLLTLRFEPSFDPESQIVIGKRPEGYAVTYYSLPAGVRSISYQMDKIVAETGETDAAVIAKQINVECQKVDIPAQVVAELMSQYSNLRLSPELDTLVTLDPTWYRLWFRASSSGAELFFSYGDAHYGHDEKAHPLVRWMNEVKRVVEKYAAAQQ